MRKKSLNSAYEQPKNLRQMVYQRGTQKEGSPHYVFLYSDEENSSDEENIPLQTRTSTVPFPRRIEVIDVQIKPDDTLQALALRYRCTISELKRINKIHKENEIFALPAIKVPVQPFSVLTENLSAGHTQHEYKEQKAVKTASEPSTSKAELSVHPLISFGNTESPEAEINTVILNSVCEPLSTFNNVNSLEVAFSESDQLLNVEESERSENSRLSDTFKCSGDDWGLSWAQLVGFSLLLGFAGPILYILYITEFSTKEHVAAAH